MEDTGRTLDLLRARVVELEAELAVTRTRQDAVERACGRLLTFLRAAHLPWRPHELDETERALVEAGDVRPSAAARPPAVRPPAVGRPAVRRPEGSHGPLASPGSSPGHAPVRALTGVGRDGGAPGGG